LVNIYSFSSSGVSSAGVFLEVDSSVSDGSSFCAFSELAFTSLTASF